MKRLIFPVALVACSALSGCAVVPYDQPYGVYSDVPYYYSQPYALAPGYAMPAPVYGAPVYVGPPVNFSFSLDYRSGRHHGFRHGFRGHTHGHFGGFHRHRFPGHRFPGHRGGWKR